MQTVYFSMNEFKRGASTEYKNQLNNFEPELIIRIISPS